MAAKKPDPRPSYRRVTLTRRDDGVLVATWPRKVVRFLMSDGSTVDVDTERDDSDLRGEVLAWTKLDKIEGSVTLPDAPTLPLSEAEGAAPPPAPEADSRPV